MFRKKATAITTALVLCGQLLAAPLAAAATADQAIKNITKDPSYTGLVNQLNVDSGIVENFVRDVVNDIDNSKLNDNNYINGVVTRKLLENDTLTKAILSLPKSEYENSKQTVINLGRVMRSELLNNNAASGAAGGGGGAFFSEEFKIRDAGRRAVVESNGKQYIFLSGSQVKEVKAAGKVLDMTFGQVKVSFEPQALDVSTAGGVAAAGLKVAIRTLPDSETKILLEAAAKAGLSRVAGSIYDLSAAAVDDKDQVSTISSFKGAVTVILPVPADFRESAAAGKVKAYFYNEQANGWQLVGGSYDSVAGTISFTTKHFSKYALLEQAAGSEVNTVIKRFSDIEGHWAANDIMYMAERGYVNGAGEGKFQPRALVTRAQFAAMLVNVLGIQGEAEVNFKDVPEGAWYYASVARACQAGLAKGKGQDTFAPEAPITRQEMASMAANAMKYKGKAVAGSLSVLSSFADNGLISDWAKQAAAEAYNLKIIKGKPSDNGLLFAPLDNATRAEAVVMLKNYLDNQ